MSKENGKLEEALEFLSLSIEKHNDALEWIATSERAEVKFLLNDFEGAVEDFEKCFVEFAIGMYSSKQYEMCGDAYQELAETALACKWWKRAFYGLDPEFESPSKTALEKYNSNECD